MLEEIEKSQNTSLAHLSDLFRRGDSAAFEQIHKLYKGKLFFYLKKKVDEWHEVEDIVADTFLALWEARQKIRSEEHIRNFLFLTARNKAFNLMKSKGRRGVQFGDANFPDLPDTEIVELELIQVEMMARLSAAVKSLPGDFREVFELSYDHQKTPAEIASLLKINPATVRSRKRRALDMIREIVGRNTIRVCVIIALSKYFLSS